MNHICLSSSVSLSPLFSFSFITLVSHTFRLALYLSVEPATADGEEPSVSCEEPVCYLPSVLRDRPNSGRTPRGAPPPVPPRSPRAKGKPRCTAQLVFSLYRTMSYYTAPHCG